MEYTVKQSGTTFIARGSSVAGFGETPEEAVSHWEAMFRADRNFHRDAGHLPRKLLQYGDNKGIAPRFKEQWKKEPRVWKGFKEKVSQESDSRTTEEVATTAVV